jgi:hypothetical protein
MSSSPKLFHTQRVTSATRARAQNILKCLDAFEAGPLCSSELQVVLEYSPSGTRKYITDFLRMGIIKTVSNGSSRTGEISVYGITDNVALIAQLREESKHHLTLTSATLREQTNVVAREPHVKKRTHIHERFPDRQIHLASDDVATGVRIFKNEGEGKRDHLVAALFGAPRTGLILTVKTREVAEAA